MTTNANPKHVLTGEARLSYVNVLQPRPNQTTGEPEYSVQILIPKTDTLTISRINAAIQYAKTEAATKLWGGVIPPGINEPLNDGDGVKPVARTPYGPECKGHWVLTAKSKRPPSVVEFNSRSPLNNHPSEVYSGMYGCVGVDFYAYNNKTKGVGCGLASVIKMRDGDPLGGSGVSVEEDLAALQSQYGATPAQPQYGYVPPNIDPLTGLPR